MKTAIGTGVTLTIIGIVLLLSSISLSLGLAMPDMPLKYKLVPAMLVIGLILGIIGAIALGMGLSESSDKS